MKFTTYNKFGAQRTAYGGVTYHSKKEAEKAAELDLLKRAGEVKHWERQVKIPLIVNGQEICTYVCDFKVTDKNNKVEYVECKGFLTPEAKLKMKLVRALYPAMTITIV